LHDTAYEHGRLFFELYGSEFFRTVVELGSQDVNGSLRDHAPAGVHYIGLDMIAAKGVDLVVSPDAPLPLADGIADAVVTSSAFEHDICFWDTFLELLRLLRPGGLLYVNAPSNGAFHRYPLDCWRFYPDAGVALVRWAARRGIEIELIESFIGLPRAERWADFVAVFRKPGGPALTRTGRIADRAPSINVHDRAGVAEAPLRAESPRMTDMLVADEIRTELTQVADGLRVELAAAWQTNATLSSDLAAARTDGAALRRTLHAAEQRTAELGTALATIRDHHEAILNSTSWRLTAGLRRLVIFLRGH
jgi:SAM-dependent methyltransferase